MVTIAVEDVAATARTCEMKSGLASSNALQWPYEEFSIKQCAGHPLRFVFSTPWAEVTVDASPLAAQKILRVQSALQDEPHAEMLQDVSWLMQQVPSLACAYTLPRGPNSLLDRHERRGCEVKAGNLLELIGEIFPNGQEAIALQENPAVPYVWRWDEPSAFALANTGQGLDPLTLLSLVRRQHLLSSIDRGDDVLGPLMRERLRTGDRLFFRRACGLILRQNHHITQMCESCLIPALPLSQQAEPFLHEFIRAEHGHDLILERAVEAVGYATTELPVLPSTQALMRLFECVAGKNFLAFAMAVEFFESGSPEAEHPFARILHNGGFSAAAEHLQRHRDINHEGQHDQIATQLLSNMAPVSPDYAREAMRLTKAISILMRLSEPEVVKHLSCQAELNCAG